jgi:outer membrane protein OmpA-like peptidoglycan-associated protein
VNYWDSKFFVPGRVGLGVDFRLSDVVTLGIEGNTNFYSDKFNSKYEEKSPLDWQFNLLAGLKFNLGKNTRPSKVYAEKVAAAEAAAAAAAAAAEAERIAAEKAAAEKAEAERIAAEKAAAEKAAAERAAIAAENSKDIAFVIGSSYIRKSEDAKLVSLAEWLKANPDFSVVVVGYADKETGSSKGNLALSQKRASTVAARLVKLGVDEGRVSTDFKGDTVQPYEVNDQNRVVVCTVE